MMEDYASKHLRKKRVRREAEAHSATPRRDARTAAMPASWLGCGAEIEMPAGIRIIGRSSGAVGAGDSRARHEMRAPSIRRRVLRATRAPCGAGLALHECGGSLAPSPPASLGPLRHMPLAPDVPAEATNRSLPLEPRPLPKLPELATGSYLLCRAECSQAGPAQAGCGGTTERKYAAQMTMTDLFPRCDAMLSW